MIALISKSALLGGAMSIALAGAALAAPSANPAAPADPAKVEKRVVVMRGGPGHGPGRGFHHRRDPEQRAQHLRDVLQLTPAQEPALTAFLESSKPRMRAERRERAPDATPPAPLTTPERLDRQLERMAKRQQAFAQRAAATKAFYAQLSPTQRKAFDALRPGGGGDRRVRVFRSEAGEAPMVFDSEFGDFGLGDMDFTELAELGELAPLPPLPPMPPMAADFPPPPAPPAPPSPPAPPPPTRF